MEVLFVVVWLVCGAIGAAIMSGKGRSGVGGFALGVLLGPIGLIIALLLSRSEENEAERQLRIEEIKQQRRQGGPGPREEDPGDGYHPSWLSKPYRRGNDDDDDR